MAAGVRKIEKWLHRKISSVGNKKGRPESIGRVKKIVASIAVLVKRAMEAEKAKAAEAA